jgi:hypothetical protein|tara:strand:+ start:599 stop:1036 length:438 start_codon:yes stop_codon:yes gene_type:complete
MRKGIKPFNCPQCGFNFFKKHNYMSKINELLKRRNNISRMHLRTVAQCIKSNVPSDAERDKYYFFLYNIQHVSDEVLIWGLDQYFKGKHYLKGKGYAYLKSIILSRDKNKEKISENEKKLLGSAPPIVNKGKDNEEEKNNKKKEK